MAFKDENGKITIDEIAAQNDIKSIEIAIERLEEARSSIVEIKYKSACFSGKTSVSITEASEQLIKKYDAVISQLKETKEKISSTVYKYQQIDSQMRDLIDGGN